MLNKTDYPYWTVGALATANHYYQDEPLHVRTRARRLRWTSAGSMGGAMQIDLGHCSLKG
jgi:hypothetical protein